MNEPIQKNKVTFKGAMILTSVCLLGVMFIPVAIVLIIGMSPTVVASLIDKSEEKLKGVTVGFLNFAGCYPFLLTLIVRKGNDPQYAFEIIFEPLNVVIMLMAAGLGYFIEYGTTQGVSGYLYQNAERRVKDIEKEQKQMVERWGKEVTGDIPLDAYGFPIKEDEQEDEKAAAAKT